MTDALMVTGAAGQLAQEVIKAAREKGREVVAFTRAELDVSDAPAVSEAVARINPAIIINCAAYNDVDGAEDDWQSAFSVNGLGPKHLALAANKSGAVLVHFSTDFVFNGSSEVPYTVSDSADPIQSYGSSKLLGEEHVREHANKYYLIRTSWVFGGIGPSERGIGPGERGTSKRGIGTSERGTSKRGTGPGERGIGPGGGGNHSFPLKVLGWAEKKNRLKVVDDQSSSPSYAVDLAAATLDLIESGKFGLYHMTNSGGGCSRYEWAAHVLKLAGWGGALEPTKSADFPTPAKRPQYSVLDNFPLKETIGYLPPTWQDATERFVRSLKPKPENSTRVAE